MAGSTLIAPGHCWLNGCTSIWTRKVLLHDGATVLDECLFGRGDWHIGRQTLARSGCDRGLEIRRIIEGSSRTEASASLVKCRAGRAGQQLPVVDVGGRGGSPAACRYADCRGVDACMGQSWLCAPGFMGGDCRGRCSPIRGEAGARSLVARCAA